RSRLVAAKAVAVAGVVSATALAVWVGLVAGVAVGGGGITLAHITALSVQLAFFGLATGASAIAIGAGTGRRSLATGVAAAIGILGWLINSHAPLARGADVPGLLVLGALALVLTAIAMAAIERRDLRG